MKKVILTLLIILTANVNAATYVRGYTKSNGTYVEGHYRSDSDGIKSNNYSNEGNYNPYTGKNAGEGDIGSNMGNEYHPYKFGDSSY